MGDDLRGLSALDIGNLIRDRKVSSPEVTRVFLDAALVDASKDPADDTKINAFVNIDEEDAMWRAEEVQRLIEAGDAPSPLAGVPMAMKDLICTKGGLTTAASKILGGFRPPYDATVAEKLHAAGAVVLGKANMDEFAMGSSTETSYYGVCRNPVDTSRVPGGSSGGSAAAVAAGLAPYATGSDTGGSIRQPCSFCGITGVKPTYGSVSRYGLMAFASSLDQIGPMARTARDCAVALSIMSGPDGRDSTSVMDAPFDVCKAIRGKYDISKMKIGLPRNYFAEGLADDVGAAVLDAAGRFEALGAVVEEFDLPLIEYAVPVYLIVACAEASSNLSRYDGVKYGYRSPNASDIRGEYYVTRSEGFGTEVKRRIMLGSFVLSSGHFDAYYKKALRVRSLIKAEFDKAFGKYDFILSPICPTVAFRIGEQIGDPLAMYLGDIYTVSVNLVGAPAVALPCGTGEGGMPVGMQLIGPGFSDPMLLGAAIRYQDEYGAGA
ncbi:MAG: Asp-tRNA(Asn)/Glu-tRNA(Gln) amidotransferase subunit GatA [Clostridiales Family XIII bacterium]|jgi:aspartyl-tRNA(Asn)/glutamyl-tRNA(Gln) amidotransferase subunit A|nr:Asp-tRNA(Asn)/Glu-tRNA(Gln) amidotransferase subunit GatA [Clostridiales Family XIII bacterium]